MLRLVLILGMPGLLSCPAGAGNAWDGEGADGKWSTAANWDANTLPTASTLIQFGGTSQLASSNDLFSAGAVSGGLQFNAGAGPFVITGNGLSLTGNVTNNSASLQTISLPLSISGASIIDAASGPITLGGVLSASGANAALMKNGSHPLTLTTGSYSGSLTVNQGTLNVLGTLPNGVAVTVGMAGTLSGTGSINRAVNIAGNIYPGVDGIGTLSTGRPSPTSTLGNTTITGQLTATGNNKLMVNGNLAFSDSTGRFATLNISESAVSATPVVIAEYTGTVSGMLGAQLTYIVEYHGGANGRQVTVMRPDDSYWYWAYGKGLTLANLALDQDPDHDGFSNLMEFILGGNPLARSGNSAPTLTTDADNFIFHFVRTDDAKYNSLHPTILKTQWSTDLSQWNDIIIPDNISGSGPVTVVRTTVDYVSVAIPKASAVNGRMFIRLAASRTL
ncbi:hypothetical protein KBB96_02465 [Luteolibacter ambystomatis]|uniref:ESPR domain-containing protein n=2 Tax=Luteolibacter ambystomatis TaxID=2824561 RepID=A0A975PFS0_9BACT|nr:hypothetical protein [Luteolibacter ambystomatis]QUE51762.1 hypothetical protein KBB96_02465 [Luteolibacter ambystomatis]